MKTMITQSIGTQTMDEEVKNFGIEERNKDVESIESRLGKTEDFAQLAEIIDLNWPNNMYKTTDLKTKGKVETNVEGTELALILDPSEPPSDRTLEEYPDLKLILNEEVTVGQIEFIRKETGVSSRKGVVGKNTNFIYALPLEIDKNGVNDTEKLFEIIKKLETTCLLHGTKKLNVVTLGNISEDYLRKCCEYIFHNSRTSITIITKNRPRGKQGQIKSKREETEKLIVRAEGKTYAELVKSAKGNVDIGQLGVKVKSIKKNESG